MRVAVDVDGVLADRVGPILEYVREEYGVSLSREEITAWDYEIPEAGIELTDAFHETSGERDHLLSVEPVDGAVEAMATLDRDHELLIATHRPPETHPITAEWLRGHGRPYDRFVEDPGEDKADVNADVLIDDHPKNALAFARNSGRGFLFRQPWNRGHSPSGTTVVREWEAVVRRL